MREMTLRLNENGSKQYESSPFPYMEVVPNMEGLLYMETAQALLLLYNSTIFCKNHFSQWQLLCVKLFPALILILIVNHCLLLFPTNFTKNT